MLVVAALKPFIVHVEGVRILHDELTTTQDACTGAFLIAVFVLDLVKRDGEILIRVVLSLYH